MKSIDEIIEEKVHQAQKPLLERIADLEKQVGKFSKQQPFMIKDHTGKPRRSIRLSWAAKRMQVDKSTASRMLKNPLCPLQGTRIGRMVYVFEDTLIFNQIS